MEKFVTLVPLFPLLGFLIQVFFGKKLSKTATTIIGSGVVFASFIVSVLVFISQGQATDGTVVHVFNWISAGSLAVRDRDWLSHSPLFQWVYA